MKFFLDTEFIEYPGHIELISIGIVGENKTEYYGVNQDADLSKASEWVRKNVLEKMPEYNKETNTLTNHTANCKPIHLIKDEILGYTYQKGKKINKCEFYGYYSDYDWVVFCWIFGTMMDLPKGYPMFCLDLKQTMYEKGLTPEWKNKYCPDPDNQHNALADAKWNKKLYEQIQLNLK
jgi:hypothetical protein